MLCELCSKHIFIFNMSLLALFEKVRILTIPARALEMQRFFKTGKGQYAEGDTFAGISNPKARQLAKQHQYISLGDIEKLIQSKIHEERFIGLVIMDHQFKKKQSRQGLYELYMKNIDQVNNWDLVDLSAPNIIGKYLLEKCQLQDDPTQDQRKILYELVASKSLWRRRISILSTFTFVRNNYFADTLKISEMLLQDKEDLIHKGVGWMLREVGKRKEDLLETFIQKHYTQMPRTMLRYSIEKFEEGKRKRYLKGQFR